MWRVLLLLLAVLLALPGLSEAVVGVEVVGVEVPEAVGAELAGATVDAPATVEADDCCPDVDPGEDDCCDSDFGRCCAGVTCALPPVAPSRLALRIGAPAPPAVAALHLLLPRSAGPPPLPPPIG